MRNIMKASVILLASILLMIRPTLSYADRHEHDEHHDHHEGHSHFGLSFSFFPERYYYDRDYVIVSPPVVSTIPDYQPVVVNGVTYFVNR